MSQHKTVIVGKLKHFGPLTHNHLTQETRDHIIYNNQRRGPSDTTNNKLTLLKNSQLRLFTLPLCRSYGILFGLESELVMEPEVGLVWFKGTVHDVVGP